MSWATCEFDKNFASPRLRTYSSPGLALRSLVMLVLVMLSRARFRFGSLLGFRPLLRLGPVLLPALVFVFFLLRLLRSLFADRWSRLGERVRPSLRLARLIVDRSGTRGFRMRSVGAGPLWLWRGRAGARGL